jgi:hypothetical protein
MQMNLRLPPPTACSLLQAALWVTRREPPIPDKIFDAAPLPPLDRFELDEYGPLRPLLLVLRSGELRSKGKFILKTSRSYDPDCEDPHWVRCSSTPTIKLPAGIWQWPNVDWQYSENSECDLDLIDVGYFLLDGPEPEPSEFQELRATANQARDKGLLLRLDAVSIQVDVQGLFRIFPGFHKSDEGQPKPDALANESHATPYVPPYVEFMMRASRALLLDHEQKVPKDEIVHWLKEHWPKNLGKMSESKIQYMATFLRRPEDEKGGNLRETQIRKRRTQKIVVEQ